MAREKDTVGHASVEDMAGAVVGRDDCGGIVVPAAVATAVAVVEVATAVVATAMPTWRQRLASSSKEIAGHDSWPSSIGGRCSWRFPSTSDTQSADRAKTAVGRAALAELEGCHDDNAPGPSDTMAQLKSFPDDPKRAPEWARESSP